MTLWHKVRLWRIDANRDKAFQIVRDALGEQLTPREIANARAHRRAPAPRSATASTRRIADLDALRVKTRKQENSMLVPLGAEWMYRYEEEQTRSNPGRVSRDAPSALGGVHHTLIRRAPLGAHHRSWSVCAQSRVTLTTYSHRPRVHLR